MITVLYVHWIGQPSGQHWGWQEAFRTINGCGIIIVIIDVL